MEIFDIKIKKILISGIVDINHPLPIIIESIINELLNQAALTSSIFYYQKAAEFILAYLAIGGSYLPHKTLFDLVLTKAGFSSDQIHNMQAKNPVIPIKKTAIRSLIGKWPASIYNSHTINDALKSILTHALKNEYGTYQYYTAKKDGTYTALYLLYVSQNQVLFHDVINNKFYQLVKESH